MTSYSGQLGVYEMHIDILSQLLREPYYSRWAQVLGRIDLDTMSKYCMLEALSWCRVQPLLALHDFRLTLHNQAAAHVIALTILKRVAFPSGVVALIDKFGGFTETLATISTTVATTGIALAKRVAKVACILATKSVALEALVLTSFTHRKRHTCGECMVLHLSDDDNQQNMNNGMTTDVTTRESYDYVRLTRWSAATISDLVLDDSWYIPLTAPADPLYRAYGSRFFQYMDDEARHVNKTRDIYEWVEEIHYNVSDRNHACAYKILDSAMSWVFNELIPAIREWHTRFMLGCYNDTILRLVTRPIATNDETEVFSVEAHGMGLGRMELLCFELVNEACEILERQRWNPQCTYWKALEEKFKLSSRASLRVRVAIAPHKPRLVTTSERLLGPSEPQRSDFLLLAYTTTDSNPSVIGYAWHTPNVLLPLLLPHYTTTRSYFKTRVTWRMNVRLPGLMEAAATSLAETLLLPTPRNESQIEDILAKQMWMQTVLQQAVDPIDASIDTETHTFASTFTRTKASVDSDDTTRITCGSITDASDPLIVHLWAIRNPSVAYGAARENAEQNKACHERYIGATNSIPIRIMC